MSIIYGKIYSPKGGGLNVLALRSPAGDGEVYASPLSHGPVKAYPTADFESKFDLVNPDAVKPVAATTTPPPIPDNPPAALNVTDTPPAG
jgi:hypothetical protein